MGAVSAASAETLFGSQEPELPRPHKDGMFTTYWASLAGNLTRLKLSFGHPVGGATISPLSQLTRLQSLSLQLNCWYADVELSLPQLKELEMVAVQHAWITLRCPQLKTLRVIHNIPLESIHGIPDGLEDLCLASALSSSDCSAMLHEIFCGQRLEQLRSLHVTMSPQSYESSVASQVIKQVLRKGRLTTLETNCPLEQLTPLTGPQFALPTSLQLLHLHLPLERGIPLVLEQLTNLRGLDLEDTKKGPMHLTRSLDPFLDMKHLDWLSFEGKRIAGPEKAQTRFEWTQEALGFLALARTRLQKEAQVPGSRKFVVLC